MSVNGRNDFISGIPWDAARDPFNVKAQVMYAMTKTEITAELTKNGYRPFMDTAVGSVTAAEAWTGNLGGKPLVILLYRKDTGEIVDLDNLPEEELDAPEISAFVDDFGDSVFRFF